MKRGIFLIWLSGALLTPNISRAGEVIVEPGVVVELSGESGLRYCLMASTKLRQAKADISSISRCVADSPKASARRLDFPSPHRDARPVSDPTIESYLEGWRSKAEGMRSEANGIRQQLTTSYARLARACSINDDETSITSADSAQGYLFLSSRKSDRLARIEIDSQVTSPLKQHLCLRRADTGRIQALAEVSGIYRLHGAAKGVHIGLESSYDDSLQFRDLKGSVVSSCERCFVIGRLNERQFLYHDSARQIYVYDFVRGKGRAIGRVPAGFQIDLSTGLGGPFPAYVSLVTSLKSAQAILLRGWGGNETPRRPVVLVLDVAKNASGPPYYYLEEKGEDVVGTATLDEPVTIDF